jgi:hypothetical protein
VALTSDRARKLANVDVHTAPVSGTGLGQGRRVIRENGETSHEVSITVDSR